MDVTERLDNGSGSMPFIFQVNEVYLNSATTSYTLVDNVLTVPAYASGTIRVKFSVYLIYGAPSGQMPSDPENPASDIVFWEERIGRMPNIGSSIKNFEDGNITFKTSNIAFTCLGDWEGILDRTDWVGTQVKMYLNESHVFTGESNGSQVSNGLTTIVVKNMASELDKECSFGDPDYLIRIDPDHSSSYYSGASIPEKYHGKVIPFVIGDRMAYVDFEGQNIDSGQNVLVIPPVVPLSGASTTSRALGTGYICRIIPTSATTGLVCRIPSFQSLNSSAAQDTGISITPQIWSKTAFGNPSSSLLPLQLVKMNGKTVGLVGAKFISGNSYQLESEMPNNSGFNSVDYDTQLHLCSSTPPTSGFDPGSISITYQNTPDGNRLVKISATGVNFIDHDHYLVCSSLSGSISAPKVAQYIFEKHDVSVDVASFNAMNSAYPQKTCIQVGVGTTVPTVNNVIAQINRSLLTYTKIPMDGSGIVMDDIDLDPTVSIELTDDDIRELRNQVTGDLVFSKIEYEPIYAKGTTYRDDVYSSEKNSDALTFFNSDKTKTIPHVLTSKPSRWQEIADYYSFPSPEVSFIYLGESIFNVGDYIAINHSDFKGNIIITSVSPKQIGSSITGKKLT
jgi:hypothetical protein